MYNFNRTLEIIAGTFLLALVIIGGSVVVATIYTVDTLVAVLSYFVDKWRKFRNAAAKERN